MVFIQDGLHLPPSHISESMLVIFGSRQVELNQFSGDWLDLPLKCSLWLYWVLIHIILFTPMLCPLNRQGYLVCAEYHISSCVATRAQVDGQVHLNSVYSICPVFALPTCWNLLEDKDRILNLVVFPTVPNTMSCSICMGTFADKFTLNYIII